MDIFDIYNIKVAKTNEYKCKYMMTMNVLLSWFGPLMTYSWDEWKEVEFKMIKDHFYK